jgi:hypothetical protein
MRLNREAAFSSPARQNNDAAASAATTTAVICRGVVCRNSVGGYGRGSNKASGANHDHTASG